MRTKLKKHTEICLLTLFPSTESGQMEIQWANECYRRWHLNATATTTAASAAAAATATSATPATATTTTTKSGRQCHRQATNSTNHGAIHASTDARPATHNGRPATNAAASNVQSYGRWAKYGTCQQRRHANHSNDTVADARARHVRSNASDHEQCKYDGQTGAPVAVVATATAECDAAESISECLGCGKFGFFIA